MQYAWQCYRTWTSTAHYEYKRCPLVHSTTPGFALGLLRHQTQVSGSARMAKSGQQYLNQSYYSTIPCEFEGPSPTPSRLAVYSISISNKTHNFLYQLKNEFKEWHIRQQKCTKYSEIEAIKAINIGQLPYKASASLMLWRLSEGILAESRLLDG